MVKRVTGLVGRLPAGLERRARRQRRLQRRDDLGGETLAVGLHVLRDERPDPAPGEALAGRPRGLLGLDVDTAHRETEAGRWRLALTPALAEGGERDEVGLGAGLEVGITPRGAGSGGCRSGPGCARHRRLRRAHDVVTTGRHQQHPRNSKSG
jgi:hypothetical protein